MRSRRARRVAAPALLSSLLSVSLFTSTHASIFLSQFQEIGGFPSACTRAYLFPLVNCQNADFSPPSAPCTNDCYQDLINITISINEACRGIMVSPETLIGLFFEGKGAETLCPVVISSENNPPPSPPPPPSQPSNVSNPPPAAASTNVSSSAVASKTFVMTSMSGAAPTNTEPGSSVAPVQPMATNGGSSSSGAVAGAQSSQPPPSSTATNGPGTFGGGAIPFTVNGSASGLRSWAFPTLGLFTGVSTLVMALIL